MLVRADRRRLLGAAGIRLVWRAGTERWCRVFTDTAAGLSQQCQRAVLGVQLYTRHSFNNGMLLRIHGNINKYFIITAVHSKTAKHSKHCITFNWWRPAQCSTRVSAAANRPARRSGSALAKYSVSHHMVIKPFLLLGLTAEYRSRWWVWSTVVRRPSEVYDTHRLTKLTAPETISYSRDGWCPRKFKWFV